jgi:hypothetical protein
MDPAQGDAMRDSIERFMVAAAVAACTAPAAFNGGGNNATKEGDPNSPSRTPSHTATLSGTIQRRDAHTPHNG